MFRHSPEMPSLYKQFVTLHGEEKEIYTTIEKILREDPDEDKELVKKALGEYKQAPIFKFSEHPYFKHFCEKTKLPLATWAATLKQSGYYGDEIKSISTKESCSTYHQFTGSFAFALFDKLQSGDIYLLNTLPKPEEIDKFDIKINTFIFTKDPFKIFYIDKKHKKPFFRELKLHTDEVKTLCTNCHLLDEFRVNPETTLKDSITEKKEDSSLFSDAIELHAPNIAIFMETLLDKACEDKLFYALVERIKLTLKKIQQTDAADDKRPGLLAKFKKDIDTLSDLYWSVGQAYAAYFSLQLGNTFISLKNAEDDSRLATFYYDEAIKHFCCARLLAEETTSIELIKVFCQGEDLYSMFKLDKTPPLEYIFQFIEGDTRAKNEHYEKLLVSAKESLAFHQKEPVSSITRSILPRS